MSVCEEIFHFLKSVLDYSNPPFHFRFTSTVFCNGASQIVKLLYFRHSDLSYINLATGFPSFFEITIQSAFVLFNFSPISSLELLTALISSCNLYTESAIIAVSSAYRILFMFSLRCLNLVGILGLAL